MRWRYWLIDLPALVVTAWFIAYRFVLMVATVITVSAVVAMLVLQCFGIQWGWR